MKKIFKVLTYSAVALTATAFLPSCAMEDPFFDSAEGNLTLTTQIRGDVTVQTRSISEDQPADLREKCVIYIENSKGIVRKYKGLDNVPEAIKLRTGSYVAEAWSGDSVSASFDKKFYRGYQPFEIAEGDNALTLKCNIANVLVSVDPTSLGVNLKDLKVTFSHSRGELVFTKDAVFENDQKIKGSISDGDKGYFMMPNADKDLAYKVEGTTADGSAYLKEGKIEGVQRAHEYAMTITEEPAEISDGGAVIRLSIAEIPVIETEFEIFPAPAVSGIGFDNLEQVVSTDKVFTDKKLYIRGYYGLNSVIVNFSDNFNDPGLPSGVNMLDNSTITALGSKGIKVEKKNSTDAAVDGQDVKVDQVFVTFTKGFLEGLPESTSEYKVTFVATDAQEHPKRGSGSFRVANTFDAIETVPPVATAPAPDPDKDPMAIGARHITLTGYVNDAEAASNFGIKYRPQGSSDWQVAYPSSANASAARRNARATRAATPVPFTVKITGLQPGTIYEYKSFSDGYEDASVNTFTTESTFTIPNASFEDWGTYGDGIVIPSLTGDKLTSFWGSGNEGSSMASMTLTDKSSEMKHSGQYSARMESKSAVGVIAAGNLFVGYYVETYKISNGKLKLGREYNGSHPSKVRVWANYRPGNNVSVKAGNEGFVEIQNGGTDHGQIYVALTDGAYDICTYAKERKLFDPNDPQVLAYGQVTWKEAFGPDGQLQMVDIPFEYNSRANTKRPTHLVITCAASKFGDFFSGSAGSVMYVDDFELVYE